MEHNTTLPGYYTTAEAAQKLGYASTSNLANGCQAGRIPAYKVGKTWLIPNSWVEEQEQLGVKGQGSRGVTRK
ncbi:helix-turn-helix domain-containing protein [Desulfovibrio desulfuricans]|uniref:Excisionase n=1 Tax=Desulfovibrio phage ProddE TaxID=2866661 RepID=A0AAE8XAQ2_9CAUD|nr:excisionase [Desulfovibrio phage ProddE]UIA98928.1 helix-turn-helix domain-containing protein [Desulfovibrio desulfuricans]